jgi:hypothetical protein
LASDWNMVNARGKTPALRKAEMEATTTSRTSGVAATLLLLFFSFLCSSLAMAAATVGGWVEEATATWHGTKSIRWRSLGFGPRGLYAAEGRVVGSRVYGELMLNDVWAPYLVGP